MAIKIPITKARINLGSIVKRASLDKELFILEKDGYPVAGIVGIDTIEDYIDINDSNLKKNIKKSFKEYEAGNSRNAKDFLKEIKKK
jgi:hypothetical protein